jgi:hypothetical protein
LASGCQFYAQTVLTAIGGIALLTYVLQRVYGYRAALLALALTIACFGFNFSSQQIRSDLAFGAAYGVVVLLLERMVLSSLGRTSAAWNAYLFGLFCVAAIASHWHGFLV